MAAAAAVLLLTAGCASAVGSLPGRTDPSSAVEASNAWKSEFEQAYSDARSDFEREVLQDGAVSPAELAEARSRVTECMRARGYRIDYDDVGGYETTPVGSSSPDPEAVRGVLRGCEQDSDISVTYLFEQVRRNPDHRSEAAIAVECLRRSGVVDGSYTSGDWKRDFEQDLFPFDEASEPVRICQIDPLGLWYRS